MFEREDLQVVKTPSLSLSINLNRNYNRAVAAAQ